MQEVRDAMVKVAVDGKVNLPDSPIGAQPTVRGYDGRCRRPDGSIVHEDVKVTRCTCVCHVGADGLWRAHACDCPSCPSGLARGSEEVPPDAF